MAAQRDRQVARVWIDPRTPVPKSFSWTLHSLSTSPAHPDDASTTRSTRPSVGGSPRREWLHQSVCRTCTRVRPCPSIPSSDGAVLQPRIRLWTPPSVVHSWVRRRRPSSHEADRGSNARAFIKCTMKVVLIYASGDATVKHMMLWKDDDVRCGLQNSKHTQINKRQIHTAHTHKSYTKMAATATSVVVVPSSLVSLSLFVSYSTFVSVSMSNKHRRQRTTTFLLQVARTRTQIE